MAHPMNGSQLQFVWKLKHKSASRFQRAPRRSRRPVIISKRFLICLIGIQRLLRWNFNRRDHLAIIFVSSPGARASSILNILSIHIVGTPKVTVFTLNFVASSFENILRIQFFYLTSSSSTQCQNLLFFCKFFRPNKIKVELDARWQFPERLPHFKEIGEIFCNKF
jgi:hypothetical protein